jgi:hypothetical protein
MRNEMTGSKLHYADDRHKPFHHACQFACSGFRVVPRQKDDNSSKADPEPVHGEVHLVAQPVGKTASRNEITISRLSSLIDTMSRCQPQVADVGIV